jgi:hypothetical protein
VQDRSFPDAKAPGDEIPTAGFCCCINSFSSPFQLVALSVSYFFFLLLFLIQLSGKMMAFIDPLDPGEFVKL